MAEQAAVSKSKVQPEKHDPGREIATIRRIAVRRGNQAAGAIWAAGVKNQDEMRNDMQDGFSHAGRSAVKRVRVSA